MKKNLQNKLKLATLLLLLCIFAGLGCVSGVSAEKTNYTDFFKKDSVINIEIFMEDDDLSDMRAYPENEEYHTADVTIDGVSLTVADLTGDTFAVSIIPHTGAQTILLGKRPGDQVNLENDVIGKYVRRLLEPYQAAAPKSGGITEEFLLQYGF